MSSHHFVREDQEPALLIVDAEATSFENIQQLLEWSPTVMVYERALEQVASWGIKIDIALVDPARRATLSLLVEEQDSIQWVDSMHSALEDGLNYFLTTPQRNINLVMKVNDQLFSKAERWARHLSLCVLEMNKRWSLIATGRFEKWLPAETYYHIRRGTDVEQKITTAEGLVYIENTALFWVGEEW